MNLGVWFVKIIELFLQQSFGSWPPEALGIKLSFEDEDGSAEGSGLDCSAVVNVIFERGRSYDVRVCRFEVISDIFDKVF